MVRDRKFMVQALRSINAQGIQEMELVKMLVDAADTLAHADNIISKKIPPLAKKSEWISVNDRLPNKDELDESASWEFMCCCLVPDEIGGTYMRKIRIIQYDILDKRWDCARIIVTHWMNIPKFPAD